MKLIYNLHFNNLRGDVFGGITAGVVALPLALAFGVQSGAGPVAGLYGAIAIGIFAAIFGYWLAGDRLSIWQIVGGSLIVGSMLASELIPSSTSQK